MPARSSACSCSIAEFRAGRKDAAAGLMARAARAAPADHRLHRALGERAVGARADRGGGRRLRHGRRAVPPRPPFLDGAGGTAAAPAQREAAAAAGETALALAPDDPRIRNLAALVVRDLALDRMGAGDHAGAVALFRRVTALAAEPAYDLANLGTSLQELGRWEEAEAALAGAAALTPDAADIRYNLGNARLMLGRWADAVDSYDAAFARDPDRALRRFNRGHALLGLGRLGEAWDDLERYWAAQRTRRPPPLPEWDGSPTAGRVLLWSEHAVGEEILAAGVARLRPPPLRRHRGGMRPPPRRAAATILPGHPHRAARRRRCPGHRRGRRGYTAAGLPPAGPVPAPRCGFSGPGRLPAADPAKVAEIARRYRSDGHPRVIGVAWRSTNPGFGQQKTMPLSDWGPILRLPGRPLRRAAARRLHGRYRGVGRRTSCSTPRSTRRATSTASSPRWPRSTSWSVSATPPPMSRARSASPAS